MNPTAVAQLCLEELLKLRHERKINHQKKFYLLGCPIDKSPSPFIHFKRRLYHLFSLFTFSFGKVQFFGISIYFFNFIVINII